MKEETRKKNEEKSSRLRQIRDYFCYGNNTDFANKLGVSANQASSICRGKASVGAESIEKVLTAFPEVSRDWLVNGVGSMFAPSSVESNPDEGPMKSRSTPADPTPSPRPDTALIDSLKAQIEALQELLRTKDKLIARLEKTLSDYED